MKFGLILQFKRGRVGVGRLKVSD